jgi:hypothetical protein
VCLNSRQYIPVCMGGVGGEGVWGGKVCGGGRCVGGKGVLGGKVCVGGERDGGGRERVRKNET